jgi:hypothetical protein
LEKIRKKPLLAQMKLIRLSLFLWLLLPHLSHAQESDTVVFEETEDTRVRYVLKKDTAIVFPRSFSEPVINEFKNDDDFRYGRPKQGVTPWQRFLFWLAGIFNLILHLLTNTLIGQIVFYGACAALLIWVIIKLLKIDVKDLFYGKSGRSSTAFKLADEDIRAVDFETEINQAVTRKQYRDAVRLVFLYSLRKLSDADLIQWMPGKTNDEYLLELKNHPSRSQLQDLRYYFEYAWYGDFEVSEQTYKSVDTLFSDFKSRLS